MKIKIIAPIILDIFNNEIIKEVEQFKSGDTEIEVVNLDHGTASIESAYDEVIAGPDIVAKVVQAEKEGYDGVFVDCFGDPAVDAAREMVSIPVVGGFQPAALTASLISGRWSIVTVLKSVVPLIQHLCRKLGIEGNVASVRDINTPVLELQDKNLMRNRLLDQIEKAIEEDGAEAIVLGCTGMLGLAQDLQQEMAKRKKPIPVVDPTAASIGYLELLCRSGISHSKFTYPVPTEKERKF